MSVQSHGFQHQVLYKADPQMIHRLKDAREQFNTICKKYTNQLVRIETLDGDVFEGVIAHCDKGILYLKIPNQGGQRSLAGQMYYNDVILPLVLYELLVITLLYT